MRISSTYPEIETNSAEFKDIYQIEEFYPKDELWPYEIQACILDEIKTDLPLYVYPSGMLSYIDIENKVLDLLNINQFELKIYQQKCYILQRHIIHYIFNLPQRVRLIEQSICTTPSMSTDKISGRINWPQTVKAGLISPRQFKMFFIYSNNKTYETAGNRVLHKTIETLYNITQDIIQYFNFSTENNGWFSLIVKANFILKSITVNLRNRFPRSIPSLNDYIKTLNHKRAFYRTTAELGLEIKNIEIPEFLFRNWTNFFVTIPENLDKLFEIYVLLRIIKGISTRFGIQPILFLQGAKSNRFIALLRYEDNQIFVYYQKNPIKSSLYTKTCKKYGLTHSKKSPDIYIQILKGGLQKNVLIEVKRTKNLNYIRSSIYKVLGYLSDFSSNQNLHPFLVLWSLPDTKIKEACDQEYIPIIQFSNIERLVDSLVEIIQA